MHDRRVARGSTYAAMVIPAGTNPEAMMSDKKDQTKKRSTMKKTATMNVSNSYQIYMNTLVNASKKYLPW